MKKNYPDYSNIQQKAIEEINQNLLLISGPGTGKTTVIVGKVAFLLKQGYKPTEILITTFTNKATDELKLRIAHVCNISPHFFNVFTIHSFCHTIIKDFAHLLRKKNRLHKENQFQLLDETEQKLLILRQHPRLQLFEEQFSNSEQFYKYIFHLFSLFDSINEHLIDRKDLWHYIKENRDTQRTFNLKYNDGIYLTDKEIYTIYEQYRRMMGENRWFDYSQVLKAAYILVKEFPIVRQALQKSYRYILVDEYQDTSLIQHEIFKLIVNVDSKICAVGDDDQGIYQFRGATVDHLLHFKKNFPHVKTLSIGDNFRSTEDIVKFSNSIVHEINHRFEKNLRSMRGNGCPVMLIEGRNHEETALTICQAIKKLMNDRAISSYSDVVLLFRSVRWGFIGLGYKKLFEQEGIPCLVHRSGSYFDQRDVRFFTEILRVLAEPKAFTFDLFEELMEGLKLSEESMFSFFENQQSIMTLNELKPQSLSEKYKITDSDDLKKLSELYNLSMQIKKSDQSILDILYRLFELYNYFSDVLQRGDINSLYQVGRLTHLAQSNEKWGDGSIVSFVKYLLILREKRSLEEVPGEIESDQVQVSTIHSVKGLQYKAVFVCNFEPQYFSRDIFQIPKALIKQQHESTSHIDNEFRLLYVALTRAKDYLFIANSMTTLYGKPIAPKAFITKAINAGELSRLDLNKIHFACNQELVDKKVVSSITLSYSGLKTYLSCPFEYQLKYIYKFQTPQTKEALLGTIIHKILESIHLTCFHGEMTTASDIDELLNYQINAHQIFSESEQAEFLAKGKKLLLNYYQSYSDDFSKIADVEQDFEVYFNDNRLVGTIDLLLTKGTGVEIIDFKTGGISDAAEEQLLTYALAYNMECGKKVSGLKAIYLESDEELKVIPNQEKLNTIESIINGVFNQIGEKLFLPRSSLENCSICFFNKSCCYSFFHSAT